MAKRKVDEIDGALQITLSDSKESPSKSSKLDESGEVQDTNNHNLSELDKTVVNFDKTLPPGSAPDGFVLVDEDLNTSTVVKSKSPIVENAPEPLMRIVFKDDSIARRYRHSAEDCLKRLVRGRSYTKFDVSKLTLKIYDVDPDKSTQSSKSRVVLDRNNKTKDLKPSSPKRKERGSSKGKESSSSRSKSQNLFTIDTAPQLPDEYDIPVYGRKFIKTMEDGVEESSEAKEELAPKQTCFNCLGNHSLRDCERPRNFHEISKNRKTFNAKKGVSTNRYHLEDDQRFGHYLPGVISPSLRRAMGLRENELPPFIYRMREIGYPPGWLEEARLQHSGLSLFNSEGVAEAGCSDEEGEIIAPGDKDQYDIAKLIDFPGFNVDTPKGVRDEWKAYWGSRRQIDNSKDAMLEFYSHKKAKEGYTRKKLTGIPKIIVSSNINPGEMEIEETQETLVENVPVTFIPPLPENISQDSTPPVPPSETQNQADSDIEILDKDKSSSSDSSSPDSSSNESDGDDENSQEDKLQPTQASDNPNTSENKTEDKDSAGSPSLDDLEMAKKKILDALDTEGREKTTEDKNNSTPQEKIAKKPAHQGSSSKFVTAGTPILKSVSPYSRLPTSENFSKNICDVINFENLPDYTGKYDKMVGLLQKVRKTLSNLQNE